jgi:hypothetical protein
MGKNTNHKNVKTVTVIVDGKEKKVTFLKYFASIIKGKPLNKA